MKFDEYFRMHITPEWSSQYIPYDEMKEMLTDIIAKAPSTTNNDRNSSRENYFLQADEEFFQFCEKEASKINTFFVEKLAEALLRLSLLKNELQYFENSAQTRHLSFSNHVFYGKNPEINLEENANNQTNINSDENSNSWIPNLRKRQLNGFHHRRRLKRHQFQKLNDLKLAFSEFYLMLIFLKNYQTLNYTAFLKIFQKHDQLFETTRGNQWRISYVDCTPFYTSKRVDQLMNEVETIYTNVLESGNRTKAMQRLRLPPLEEKQPRIVTFRLGIFIGMLCLLIPILIILGLTLFGPKSSKELNWRAALHLYRSSFLIITHVIFFGINVYVWSKYGVNYVLIFEIDPRKHLTYQKILEIGTFLMVIWFLSMNIFLLSFYYDIYPFIHPLCLILFLIFFLINPFPIFYRQSRYWFIKKLCRVFVSPYYPVKFTDFWIGDQLSSLELVFFDVEYFLCFYMYGSNISSSNSDEPLFCSGWSQISLQLFFQSLPTWFRFVQCLRRYRDTKKRFPHLANAGKYASSFPVIISNALRRIKSFNYHQSKLQNPFLYIWVLTAFISSTYKLIWEIRIGWGFSLKNYGENKYLREQLIYPKKIYYYLAIIMDIIFRYLWTINIFLHFNSLFAEYSDITGFSFALIEIFRRFIWNFFRLENEHLNNCGEFRAVRDISIRPTILPSRNFLTSEDMDQSISSQMNINEGRMVTRRLTTINDIPLRTINHSSKDRTLSLTRKKTNAEEFIDEINTILSLETTPPITMDE